ncbi:MAG: choice-of-anchor J domain-containing protein [Saprospiraceae bacterium]|nr:choice-of-anchor J domain-containing protein [Saprospiraceae bacterium]
MKQFLLLLTLVVFSFSSYGQVLYEQDFTNGKGDMITIDNDKKSPNSQVADYAESWGVRNGVAINNSWYEPVGKADDWLITPIITGITDKTILTWTAAAFDATFSNTYRVMVSPTGGENISDFTDVLIDVGPENNQLTNRLANLDKYVGKSIRIAFHDYSNDLFLMLVDNIKVITLIDVDGQVSEALSTSYVVKNSETDVLFQFRNVGLNPITSAVLEVSDGTLSENINIDGINLAYAETYENVYKYTVKNTTKIQSHLR